MADSKIEQYLIELMITYQQVGQDMWLLDDKEHSLHGVAVMQIENLVVIRAGIMDVPKSNLLELYTKLLELNATDVVHGAYAVDKNKIILIDTLQYESMDREDFQASLDSFSMALVDHYPILSKYREISISKDA